MALIIKHNKDNYTKKEREYLLSKYGYLPEAPKATIKHLKRAVKNDPDSILHSPLGGSYWPDGQEMG